MDSSPALLTDDGVFTAAVEAAPPEVVAVLEELGEPARALERPGPPEGSERILVTAAHSVEPRAVRELADRIHDQAVQHAKDELDEEAVERGDVPRPRELPDGRVRRPARPARR